MFSYVGIMSYVDYDMTKACPQEKNIKNPPNKLTLVYWLVSDNTTFSC